MPPSRSKTEPRIMLTAVRCMDEIARRFRRRLRQTAIELARHRGQDSVIDSDAVLRAVPLAYRELLCETDCDSEEKRDSRGERDEAA